MIRYDADDVKVTGNIKSVPTSHGSCESAASSSTELSIIGTSGIPCRGFLYDDVRYYFRGNVTVCSFLCNRHTYASK